MTQEQALSQIHTRTYSPDADTVVVVVGTRESIAKGKDYTECEFVFTRGKLTQVGIVSDQPVGLK